MKRVTVNDEDQALIAIRDEIQRLHEAGYKKVDIQTSVDENGYQVITVFPIDHDKKFDEKADKEGFLK